VAKTAWGAPLEPTADEKAAQYFATLQSVMKNKEGLCLGSYAFLWGQKQETTPTWYGMLLPSGEKLPAVDAVVRQWTGEWPANRSPKIEALRFANQADRAKAGTRLEAIATVSDRDEDDLTYEWTVMAESTRPQTRRGCREAFHRPFRKRSQSGRGPECSVIFPPPGAYRLFLVVRDGKGGASTANLPFLSE
jgi:PKD domain.